MTAMNKAQPMMLHNSSSRALGSPQQVKEMNDEIDPFFKNQQSFMMKQRQALEKQSGIYNKHLSDYAGPMQQKRNEDLQMERMKEERRRAVTQQMMDQQRSAVSGVKSDYKNILHSQIAEKEMKKQAEYIEKQANVNRTAMK